MSSGYNRMTRPIGVLCGRERYRQICALLAVDPHRTDLLHHVYDRGSATHRSLCRLVTVRRDRELVADYDRVRIAALSMVAGR